MRLLSTALLVAASCVALAAPARAADEEESELTGRLAVGWAAPIGATGDFFLSGFSGDAGFDWRPYPESAWVLQGDLTWSRFNAEQRFVDLAQSAAPSVHVDDGSLRVWGLTGGARYYFPYVPSVRGRPLQLKFYALGAVGAYHREVDMTQTVLVTPTYCDWNGYCYAGQPAPGDVVVYTKSTTKFGWNAGLGVEFPMEAHQWWYIEVRFQRIETPNPIEYVPISLGVRF